MTRIDLRLDTIRRRADQGMARDVLVAQLADLLKDPRWPGAERREVLRRIAASVRQLDEPQAERLLRAAIRTGAAPRALRSLKRFRALPIYQRFASIYLAPLPAGPTDEPERTRTPPTGRGAPDENRQDSTDSEREAEVPVDPFEVAMPPSDGDEARDPEQPEVEAGQALHGDSRVIGPSTPEPTAEPPPARADEAAADFERSTGPLSARRDEVLASLGRPSMPPPTGRPDFAPPNASPIPSVQQGASQLQTLIDRIDAFRDRRVPPSPTAGARGGNRWSCNDRLRLDTAGRAALGVESLKGLDGPDGDELRRRLARRLPFSNLELDGDGVFLALSGTPGFTATGSFEGYSGRARAIAAVPADTLGLTPDTISEFTHEGRTPLNAILGYAQMIEAEILGPAPLPYREDAGAIMEDATRLLTALDALGDSAAIADGRVAEARAPVALGPLARRVVEEHEPLAHSRDVDLRLAPQSDDVVALADEVVLGRSLSRLIGACIAVAVPGETVTLSVRAASGGASIAMGGPAALAELDADAPVTGRADLVEGEVASVLGFGFALRLARRFAESQGGRFVLSDGELVMMLAARKAALSA